MDGGLAKGNESGQLRPHDTLFLHESSRNNMQAPRPLAELVPFFNDGRCGREWATNFWCEIPCAPNIKQILNHEVFLKPETPDVLKHGQSIRTASAGDDVEIHPQTPGKHASGVYDLSCRLYDQGVAGRSQSFKPECKPRPNSVRRSKDVHRK